MEVTSMLIITKEEEKTVLEDELMIEVVPVQPQNAKKTCPRKPLIFFPLTFRLSYS
jgi:hypothetical protein